MLIQWFPGHMTKAIRMMEENIKLVDSVIYVLDARCILASFNPKLNKLCGNKPILYIINKADLVEKADLAKWLDYFKRNNMTAITTNSASGNTSRVVEELKKINKELIDRYQSKGANRSVRAMVVGIPNSGKSTLVNSLCGSKRTITGDRPGVTRGKQWVVLSKGVELLDTPGTLWPSFENQTHAMHLAFVGSINEDILNLEELSYELILYLMSIRSKEFFERYKVDYDMLKDLDRISTLELLAKKRGFLLKGGIFDLERLSKAIIDDFRKQKFGKIMLEQANEKEN